MAFGAGGFGARASPLAGTAEVFDARNCRPTPAEIEGEMVSANDFVKCLRNTEGLPAKLVATDDQALACADTSFDTVTCLVGLMFF